MLTYFILIKNNGKNYLLTLTFQMIPPAQNPYRDLMWYEGYWGTHLTDKLLQICILISFGKV